jgi:predicted HD phosphohydrolase
MTNSGSAGSSLGVAVVQLDGIVPRPVAFTRMQDGSPEEFATVKLAERAQKAALPGRILEALSAVQEEGVGGYQVSRLEHSLQSASRAFRADEELDYVVAALIHDIGDILAPYSHGQLAAAVIRPFVSPRIAWILEHHPVFSMYYYAHFIGGDRNARDKYRGHEWFGDAVFFCERYDENCFDPEYDALPLEHFAPMVREVFGRDPQTV